MPDSVANLWPAISKDLEEMMPDDGTPCGSVNCCVEYIKNTCYVELGVQCNADLIMDNFSRVCPHVLEPSHSTALLFMLGNRMSDIIGTSSVYNFRSKLVRQICRIAGPATEIEVSALLQE